MELDLSFLSEFITSNLPLLFAVSVFLFVAAITYTLVTTIRISEDIRRRVVCFQV